MPPTEYRIEKIEDFQKVPDGRLLACLQEFVGCVLDVRPLQQQGIGMESFTWIDDGIPMIRDAVFSDGERTETIHNPYFPQGAGPEAP